MIISMIMLGISFFLDGILTNFLPYEVGNLSYFTPMMTITCLVIIYQFFHHQEKKYLVTCFLTGFLYDLFYTNLWFVNGLLFLFLGFSITKFYRMIGDNYVRILIQILSVLILYECSFAFLISIFQMVPMTFEGLFYKIIHSLLLNLIYGELLYVIIQFLPKRWKRKRIN